MVSVVFARDELVGEVAVEAVRVGEPRWVAIFATQNVYGPTISAAEYNNVRLLSLSLIILYDIQH